MVPTLEGLVLQQWFLTESSSLTEQACMFIFIQMSVYFMHVSLIYVLITLPWQMLAVYCRVMLFLLLPPYTAVMPDAVPLCRAVYCAVR